LRMEGVSQAYPAYLFTPPCLIVTYTMGGGRRGGGEKGEQDDVGASPLVGARAENSMVRLMRVLGERCLLLGQSRSLCHVAAAADAPRDVQLRQDDTPGVACGSYPPVGL
jgi:hypothetical protein